METSVGTPPCQRFPHLVVPASIVFGLHRQGIQFHEGNAITCAQSTSARPCTAQLLPPKCISFCRALVEPQAREQRLSLLRGSGRFPW